jgi:hypothetical protein
MAFNLLPSASYDLSKSDKPSSATLDVPAINASTLTGNPNKVQIDVGFNGPSISIEIRPIHSDNTVASAANAISCVINDSKTPTDGARDSSNIVRDNVPPCSAPSGTALAALSSEKLPSNDKTVFDFHKRNTLILQDGWNVDAASRYNALLNSIALDDAETMTRVIEEGHINVNLPIDVRRVRAITAPNYVVALPHKPRHCYIGDGTGVAPGQQLQATFSQGHELRCPLLPTPVVIAALSFAPKCLGKLIDKFGALIGHAETGVTRDHLIEELFANLGAHWIKIYALPREMAEQTPQRWPNTMPPTIQRWCTVCQILDELVKFEKAPSLASDGKANAVHPFALLRREGVRGCRRGLILNYWTITIPYYLSGYRMRGTTMTT